MMNKKPLYELTEKQKANIQYYKIDLFISNIYYCFYDFIFNCKRQDI